MAKLFWITRSATCNNLMFLFNTYLQTSKYCKKLKAFSCVRYEAWALWQLRNQCQKHLQLLHNWKWWELDWSFIHLLLTCSDSGITGMNTDQIIEVCSCVVWWEQEHFENDDDHTRKSMNVYISSLNWRNYFQELILDKSGLNVKQIQQLVCKCQISIIIDQQMFLEKPFVPSFKFEFFLHTT